MPAPRKTPETPEQRIADLERELRSGTSESAN